MKTAPMRKSDVAQLWITGVVLVFLATVLAFGQSQDYINATLTERLNGLELRLGRLESLGAAITLALLGNLFAHVLEIRSRRKDRS